jgi:hypothetical protein
MLTKLPLQFRELLVAGEPLSEDLGEKLAIWAKGAPPKQERQEAPRLSPAEARARAARRRAEFARLRGEGLTTAQAGAAVGISDSHARKYERDRKKALAEAESAP